MASAPPPKEAHTAQAPDALQRAFDVAPKALALVTGLAYASGFLAVNSYYASLGVQPIDVLRLEYFLAGGTFLLFVAMISGLSGRFFLKWESHVEDQRDNLRAWGATDAQVRRFADLYALMYPVSGFTFAFIIVSTQIVAVDVTSMLALFSIGLVASAHMSSWRVGSDRMTLRAAKLEMLAMYLATAVVFWDLPKQFTSLLWIGITWCLALFLGRLNMPLGTAKAALSITSGLVLLLGITSANFGTYVLPKMSNRFGGLKPQPVMIYFAESTPRSIMIVTGANALNTVDMFLFAETANELVLGDTDIASGPKYRIDRKLVSAMVRYKAEDAMPIIRR